jgi:hypothetical protein
LKKKLILNDPEMSSISKQYSANPWNVLEFNKGKIELYFSSFLYLLVDIFEKLKNLVGGLSRGCMARSQNTSSPEIYMEL